MSNIKNCTPDELLRELSLAFGPPGCEGNVADIIMEYTSAYADSVERDNLGSVIAVYNKRTAGMGSIGKLMLTCHMDEVGFMVKSIDGDGYLHISPLGIKNVCTLAARSITVGDEYKKLPGYFGIKPVHLGGGDKESKIDSMYVDIGAKNKEDAEKYVKAGDFGSFGGDYSTFGDGGHMRKCKAVDSRLTCAVLCLVLKELSDTKADLPYDVYFTFTCRDEIKHSGACAAAFKIQPDTVIFLGSSEATDGADGEKPDAPVLGGGVCTSYMSNHTVYDRALTEFIIGKAGEYGVPLRICATNSAAYTAGEIAKVACGARCAVISVPVRYPHTISSVIDSRDYESMVKIVSCVVLDIR